MAGHGRRLDPPLALEGIRSHPVVAVLANKGENSGA